MPFHIADALIDESLTAMRLRHRARFVRGAFSNPPHPANPPPDARRLIARVPPLILVYGHHQRPPSAPHLPRPIRRVPPSNAHTKSGRWRFRFLRAAIRARFLRRRRLARRHSIRAPLPTNPLAAQAVARRAALTMRGWLIQAVPPQNHPPADRL